MAERRSDSEHAERRALAADLARTQAVLQARSEQLQGIFASRWYRLARFTWRLRHGRIFRRAAPPRMAGEGSFARPLNGDALAAEEPGVWLASGPPNAETVGSGENCEAAGAPIPSLDHRDPEDAVRPGQPARLLLAGHSLDFCGPIALRARRSGAMVREDLWRTHGAHDEGTSAAALAWADVVLCEWCLGNAVWYSRHKRPGQRLLVRFHRMELDTSYPAEVDLEQVDAMVFVAQHVMERACERFGWDVEDPKLRLLPNGVALRLLHRDKVPEARSALGMIGYVPRLKRLDLALDILESLRLQDDRYRLLVKGREPWEYEWMSGRSEECAFYETLWQRLDGSPSLREAVSFEPFGNDVPAFLQRTGWILSTSEVEGHSVATAEGMASGSVPVVLERPGAADQYEKRWVHADPTNAAQAILRIQEQDEVETEGEAARRFAERWGWKHLGPAWDELLLGAPVA
jgi:glycosyltransferase involved in cell wall biosynthesis